MATSVALELHVTLRKGAPLGREVYRQLRDAILGGRLRPGESLPPSRLLAERLDVARNTVTNAYRRLVAEGFAAGRAGAGTIVTASFRPGGSGAAGGADPRARPGRPATSGSLALRRFSEPSGRASFGALEPRALWKGLATGALGGAREVPFDFRPGVPDAALFPSDVWRRLVAHELRRRRTRESYLEPEGLPRLRAAIARHVAVARSVTAGPEEVLVTSGAQQAFDLVARVLVEPGSVVAVEDPGYPPARRAFEAHGARVSPVPVDGEGLVVDALPPAARLVYVTPSHQFPLGTPMSLGRRLALLAWAERRGAAILEDDYDSEFRFDGRPLEPLSSLDRSGRVLYVGSFSKTLRPSLRVGYLVAPPSLVPALRAAKALADGHGPPVTQAALARLIEEGLFARHVRRAQRVYAERRERLLAALERHLAGSLEPVAGSAGLHLTVAFRGARAHGHAAAGAERGIARRALEAGVAVDPLGPYCLAGPRAGLVLGLGAIPAGRIEEGIRRLDRVLGSR